MDLVLSNPGYFHIGERILSKLDFKTLWLCRAVSPTWRDFVDNAFKGLVENWRRFHFKGDFVFYQTTELVKSMDYNPGLVLLLKIMAYQPKSVIPFGHVLDLCVFYVENIGNLKGLDEFLCKALALSLEIAKKDFKNPSISTFGIKA